MFASGLDINSTELDNEEMYHTNFKLRSTGEFLAVTSDDGTILHSYESYPKQFGDISYGTVDDTVGYLLTPTLGEANVTEVRNGLVESPTIETEHGFFTESIQVTIANADETATLRYTLDGSTPSEDNGEIYSGPITVNKTTVVRAAATKDGMMPSRVDTRSYIFLEDILTQSLDGEPQEGWPERWGSNRTDYGMDPDIVNDPDMGTAAHQTLSTQIPSFALSTPIWITLFDGTERDLRSMRTLHGIEVAERPASVEMLNARWLSRRISSQRSDLRIRGWVQPEYDSNPKHAFPSCFSEANPWRFQVCAIHSSLSRTGLLRNLTKSRLADHTELFVVVSAAM